MNTLAEGLLLLLQIIIQFMRIHRVTPRSCCSSIVVRCLTIKGTGVAMARRLTITMATSRSQLSFSRVRFIGRRRSIWWFFRDFRKTVSTGWGLSVVILVVRVTTCYFVIWHCKRLDGHNRVSSIVVVTRAVAIRSCGATSGEIFTTEAGEGGAMGCGSRRLVVGRGLYSVESSSGVAWGIIRGWKSRRKKAFLSTVFLLEEGLIQFISFY